MGIFQLLQKADVNTMVLEAASPTNPDKVRADKLKINM